LESGARDHVSGPHRPRKQKKAIREGKYMTVGKMESPFVDMATAAFVEMEAGGGGHLFPGPCRPCQILKNQLAGQPAI
jgi:hypothetical protein